MSYISHNAISIQSIARPTSPLDQRLTKKDAQLYDAYLGNLAAAKSLGLDTTALYHDAWLLLNLSVECFLKHIYCLLRSELSKFSPPRKKFPLGPLDYDGSFVYFHKSALNGTHMTAKDFDHEVMELYELIWRFTDANQDTHFQNIRDRIPTKSDWIEARYSTRNHIGYLAPYKDYLADFELVLNGIFGGLK